MPHRNQLCTAACPFWCVCPDGRALPVIPFTAQAAVWPRWWFMSQFSIEEMPIFVSWPCTLHFILSSVNCTGHCTHKVPSQSASNKQNLLDTMALHKEESPKNTWCCSCFLIKESVLNSQQMVRGYFTRHSYFPLRGKSPYLATGKKLSEVYARFFYYHKYPGDEAVGMRIKSQNKLRNSCE